jgi:transcriptional regulator with XRE-family HTH domain
MKNRIKELRKKSNMTAASFAEKVGVSLTTLSKWENDRGNPREETWEQIADILGVSIGYVMGITNEWDEMLYQQKVKSSEMRKEIAYYLFSSHYVFSDSDIDMIMNTIEHLGNKNKTIAAFHDKYDEPFSEEEFGLLKAWERE